MLYTLSEKILPAYFEDFAFGDTFYLHKSINPIPSRTIQALHFHKYLELGICLKGHGVTYIDNRCYRFSEGDMVITPPGLPHLSVAESGMRCDWHWMSIELSKIFGEDGIHQPSLREEMLQHSYSGVFHPWEHPRLAEVIRQIGALEPDSDRWTFMECAFLVGQLLIECSKLGDVDSAAEETISSSVKVAPALAYIRANYADKDAVREERIAQACAMSTSHFRATFKRETGMTVQDFIIQTRLATAAHLLMSTEENVLSVAMESGFGQISCFNRMFFREFGETPTAFRKKFRSYYPAGTADKTEKKP